MTARKAARLAVGLSRKGIYMRKGNRKEKGETTEDEKPDEDCEKQKVIEETGDALSLHVLQLSR